VELEHLKTKTRLKVIGVLAPYPGPVQQIDSAIYSYSTSILKLEDFKESLSNQRFKSLGEVFVLLQEIS
jgi:hypothetical protein